MKFGPCLRNSVVSPTIGQPIVPGGNPFFLYLTSFHLNKADEIQSKKRTTTRITKKTAIDASKKSSKPVLRAVNGMVNDIALV